MKYLSLTALLLFVGCSVQYHEIPAGYSGKIQTETGFENTWRGPGMVDLGIKKTDGRMKRLILIERTTYTIKEAFGLVKANDDHRVNLADGTPISCDVYLRCILAKNKDIVKDDGKGGTKVMTKDFRDELLIQVTPNKVNDRVSVISVKSVYYKFAQQTSRSRIRSIIAKYKRFEDVNKLQDEINNKLRAEIITVFREANVPLQLQSADISNVKPDPVAVRASNDLAASLRRVAEIDSIGRALRRNPEYVEWRWMDVYRDIGQKNPNATFVVGTVGNGLVMDARKRK